MQKNIFSFLFLMLAFVTVQAQFTPAKKSLHPVTDSVATAMCSCVMNNKDSITSITLFYAALDACLKSNSAPRIDALLKEDGFVDTDDRKSRADAIRSVGRKLGQLVNRDCLGFKELLNNLTAKENKPELH